MFKKYTLTIFRHFIIWTFAFSFWTLLRNFGQEVIREYEGLSILQEIRIHISLGLVAGLLFGSLEFILQKYVYKRLRFGAAILITSLSYLLVIIAIIYSGARLFARIMEVEILPSDYKDIFLSNEMILLFAYLFLVGVITDFFKEINKKFGKGNLWKMLKGEFYTPKEKNRIFMFLDLRDSTAIAEKLGHIEYSKFIQDCFKDLVVIDRFEAEVYQYVGDEVVLTWNLSKGLKEGNCINAFLSFQKKLKSRSSHYMGKYRHTPVFKAGIHMGLVTIAEIGELKREIAYHGDTINTASRIQSLCNKYNSNLLLSETVKDSLSPASDFDFKYEDELQLRGRAQKMKIFSLK